MLGPCIVTFGLCKGQNARKSFASAASPQTEWESLQYSQPPLLLRGEEMGERREDPAPYYVPLHDM